MKIVQIGKSALKGGRIAYGCWRIAGTAHGSEVTSKREAQGVAAIRAAWECGCTVFDLADIYSDGAAEQIFGRARREIPELRQAGLIATKCGIRKRGDGGPEVPYRYDFSKEHIVRSCESSLRRLGVDCIDLYQLHRPDYLCDPEEVAAAFAQLRGAGKVREFGVSNFRPTQLAALQRALPWRLVAHQVEISLTHLHTLDDGTLDQCLLEDLTPMAWSPLGGGRLATTHPIELHDADHAKRIRLREELERMARNRGVSRAVVAMAWLLRHPAGIMPVIGSTQPERIRDAASADALELSREEWYGLLEAARGERLP